MADANGIYERVMGKAKTKDGYDEKVLAACVIAEGLIKLGESIERAAKVD